MNWLKRASRTALQSAVGYIAVALPNVNWGTDKALLKATIIGIGVTAVAAALAAVMNLEEEE